MDHNANFNRSAKWFVDKFGLSSATLRNWENEGKIFAYRCPGGKRLYNVQSVTSLIGIPDQQIKPKEKIIYARVSSTKQKEDLERQTLLERCYKGVVDEVVVLHKDRLSRIATDLLEFVFEQTGVKLVVHSPSTHFNEFNDLADDFLAISTYFVASHHGKKSAQHNAKRKQAKKDHESQENSSISNKRTRIEA